jgi:hypothetical protein
MQATGTHLFVPIGVTPSGVTRRGLKGVLEREEAPIGELMNLREHAAWAMRKIAKDRSGSTDRKTSEN